MVSLDDQVKGTQCEDLTKKRLQETETIETSNHLVGINNLTEGISITLCQPYVEQKLESIEKDSILDFEQYFFKNGSTISPSSIFATYKYKTRKNRKRRFEKFIAKVEIKVKEKAIN